MAPSTEAAPEKGINLTSIVKVAAGCEVIAQRLLSGIVITDTAGEAMELSRRDSGRRLFVSRDGVI